MAVVVRPASCFGLSAPSCVVFQLCSSVELSALSWVVVSAAICVLVKLSVWVSVSAMRAASDRPRTALAEKPVIWV